MKSVFAPYCFICFLFCCGTITGKAGIVNSDSAVSITGRWDITIYDDGKEYPSWLEVQHSGFNTLVGEFVGIAGSARPVSEIDFSHNILTFSIPPQWESGAGNLSVKAELQADTLAGKITMPDGKVMNFSAAHAPDMRVTAKPAWQKPVTLFNGKDLTGWHAAGKVNQWIAGNGILQSPHSGSNLITDQAFKDFKLHIEFRYPEGSNSGVYLRGRYEVQIEASHGGEPYKGVFSAVYGFIAPGEIAAKKPGEWQSYDITLVGRMVTVVANGRTVICNREIPGITGGAINSKEGEPGPLLLQGDHGAIEYRNIVITPAK
ncbi:DUF1080 domain-containing protein [Parafilimonas sp.]|uniref:3-keto-disaccharide hydrolase n=1 Tax=Parafilimonas sp. TaxID=1969739 RepID=UPI0039E6468A